MIVEKRNFKVLGVFMFRFIIAGFLLCLCSVQADASTIRYEFDIVSSVIDYGQLYKLGNPGEDNTVSDLEYDAFLTKYHDLGTVRGQTGTVILEATPVSIHPEPNNFTGYLSCVSGFLCSIADIFNPAEKPPVHVSSFGLSFGPCCGTFRHEWSLNGQTLRFNDDFEFVGFGDLDGIQYSWWMPRATFSLANLSVSVVDAAPVPVPLPASVGLLGLGLAALGLTRRRRTA